MRLNKYFKNISLICALSLSLGSAMPAGAVITDSNEIKGGVISSVLGDSLPATGSTVTPSSAPATSASVETIRKEAATKLSQEKIMGISFDLKSLLGPLYSSTYSSALGNYQMVFEHDENTNISYGVMLGTEYWIDMNKNLEYARSSKLGTQYTRISNKNKKAVLETVTQVRDTFVNVLNSDKVTIKKKEDVKKEVHGTTYDCYVIKSDEISGSLASEIMGKVSGDSSTTTSSSSSTKEIFTFYIDKKDLKVRSIESENVSSYRTTSASSSFAIDLYYPESVSIPVSVSLNATIASGYTIKKRGITYKIAYNSSKIPYFTVYKARKTAKKVVIPARIKALGKNYPVKEISAGSFAYNKRVRAVILGKSVNVIKTGAFNSCKKLRLIKLRSKVTRASIRYLKSLRKKHVKIR